MSKLTLTLRDAENLTGMTLAKARQIDDLKRTSASRSRIIARFLIAIDTGNEKDAAKALKLLEGV
ncbi:MAG TPA: hypothetical protein VI728_11100 [Syntrophales bacterium]|nr:hypothetical protein [Syntrophales bacterium]